MNTTRTLDLIVEYYKLMGADFEVLMEAWARGSIRLIDWESNKNKYGTDITGRPDEGAQVTIDSSNFVYVPEVKSIVKGDFVYIPGPMIIDKKSDRLKLLEYIKQKVDKGESITASCWPGLAFAGNTFPASMWQMFTKEEQQATEKMGGWDAKVIYALDGQPLSRILASGVTVPPAGKGVLPDWLSEINDYVWGKIKAGEVEMRRIASGAEHVVAGFQSFLALLTPVGDAVLLLSYEHAKAAYVIKKRVVMEGGEETDWDVAIDYIMRTLRAEYQMARQEGPTAAPRQPKLQLSDWLHTSGNGYRMRRDFNVERIKLIIDQGINYADALDLA